MQKLNENIDDDLWKQIQETFNQIKQDTKNFLTIECCNEKSGKHLGALKFSPFRSR